MKMLQDVTDWFKAEILGDQSLQQERKKQKSQKDFEKRINEAARHVCLSDRPNDDGAPYPVICMDGTVIYKICENPRIEKGEISLEDVGEVLVRQRIHYAEAEGKICPGKGDISRSYSADGSPADGSA